MPRLTITLDQDLDELITERAEADDYPDSKSENVTHLVRRGLEADELEQELEHAEARADELRQQMLARDQVESKVDTLARRLEDQERSQDAPFPIRWLRWWRSREE